MTVAEICHAMSRTYVAKREGREQWLKDATENQWLKDAMSWLKDANATRTYKISLAMEISCMKISANMWLMFMST